MIGFHPPIHEPPERVSLTCPLGLRFFDVATGAFLREDLQATALPVGAPPWQDKITAVSTPGGILAFHGLPGLRDFENSDSEDPWQTLQTTRAFQIEVTDALGRFLPCTFAINAPARELAAVADTGSPPWTENGAVPLFSASRSYAHNSAFSRRAARQR